MTADQQAIKALLLLTSGGLEFASRDLMPQVKAANPELKERAFELLRQYAETSAAISSLAAEFGVQQSNPLSATRVTQ